MNESLFELEYHLCIKPYTLIHSEQPLFYPSVYKWALIWMNAWEKCSTKGRGPVETPGKVTCKRRDTHVEEDGDEDNAREDGEDPPILHGMCSI